MTKKAISTDNAPKVSGPYSQAVVVGDFVFCSGQIGIDPQTEKLVSYGIADQVNQALKNLKAIAERAGSSFDKAVKGTVYITNLNYYPIVNEVYQTYFSLDSPPARSTVVVSSLPKGALVEIELICYL